MKLIDFIITMILIAVLYFAGSMVAKGDDTYDADYIGNYDADTVTLWIHAWKEPPVFVEIPVRIAGVDAPEIRGKCANEKALAKEAKKFVADVLGSAEELKIEVLGRGKYGRLLVNLDYDGSDLATDLLDMGYARPYDGKVRKGWCDQEV